MEFCLADNLPLGAVLLGLSDPAVGQKESDRYVLYSTKNEGDVYFRPWRGGNRVLIGDSGYGVTRYILGAQGRLTCRSKNVESSLLLDLETAEAADSKLVLKKETGNLPLSFAGCSWDGEGGFVKHPKKTGEAVLIEHYAGARQGEVVILDPGASRMVEEFKPTRHRLEKAGEKEERYIFYTPGGAHFFACNTGGKFLWGENIHRQNLPERGEKFFNPLTHEAVVDGGLARVEDGNVTFRKWNCKAVVVGQIPPRATIEGIFPSEKEHFLVAFSDGACRVGQKRLVILRFHRELDMPQHRRAAWDLSKYLRDFYYKPGGPGFFKAIEYDE